MNDNLYDYALRIDGPLFRRQRLWLLEMADRMPEKDRIMLDGSRLPSRRNRRPGSRSLRHRLPADGRTAAGGNGRDPPQPGRKHLCRPEMRSNCSHPQCYRVSGRPEASDERLGGDTTRRAYCLRREPQRLQSRRSCLWDNDPALLKFMELTGILGFSIQIFFDNSPARGWTFDDKLVAEERVSGLDAALEP